MLYRNPRRTAFCDSIVSSLTRSMGTNFRPRESRGLQNVGLPSERDSAVFSDAISRSMSYSNIDAHDLATDLPEMSIVNTEGAADAIYTAEGIDMASIPLFSARFGPQDRQKSRLAEPSYPRKKAEESSHSWDRRRPMGHKKQNVFQYNSRNSASRVSPATRIPDMDNYRSGTTDSGSRYARLYHPSSVRQIPIIAQDPLSTRDLPTRVGNRVDSRISRDQWMASDLTQAERHEMAEIYDELRLADFEIPSFPQIMSADNIHAAFAHYFSKALALPHDFESNAAGCLQLLAALDYEDQRGISDPAPEVLLFALEQPHRKSSWKLVLRALAWIRQCVKKNLAAYSLPDLQNGKVSSFNFEQFLEYAEFSEYSVLLDQGEVSSQLDQELDLSLRSLVDIERNRVVDLEGEVESIFQAAKEVEEMRNETAKLKSDSDKLRAEIDAVDLANRGINNAVMEKNQKIARLAGDIDLVSEELHLIDTEIQSKFSQILGSLNDSYQPSILTTEKVLQDAQQLVGARDQYSKLSIIVDETNNTMLQSFERPAREKLTTVRIAVDDYNSRLANLIYPPDEQAKLQMSIPNDLKITGKVPRYVVHPTEDSNHLFSESLQQSIWGKSATEMLGTTQDLSMLQHIWSKLQIYEQDLTSKIEDDTKEINTELPSLENRQTTNKAQIKRSTIEIEGLQATKIKCKETLAERKLKRESRNRSLELLAAKLTSLTHQLETEASLVQRLQSDKEKNERLIREKIPRKLVIENELLDHQIARKVLDDKVAEIRSITEAMRPSTLEAQDLLAKFTPGPTKLTSDGKSPQQYAKELFLKRRI